MRISKIEFENFRNFRDYGKIRCSTDGKVTIIYGKNGDGKTTLHQLFQWIFYGQVHFNKTTTDRLYNLQFESEQPYGSTFDVMGRIDFEHEGVQYSLTRTYKYKKGIDDSEKIGEDFSLNQRDEDFNWKRVDRPKEVIEKMLPSGLSEYFFFDGESMIADLRVKGRDSAGKLRKALYSMFDLDVLEAAINHIGRTDLRTTVLGKLYLSKGNISSGSEISTLKYNIEQAQARIDEYTDRLNKAKSDKEEKHQLIAEISEKIGGTKSKAEYEARRKELRAQRDLFLKNAEAQQSAFGKEVMDMYPFLLLSKAVEDAKRRIHMKAEQSKLPTGVTKSLVTYLLKDGTTECICGQPLCEDQKNHIRKYLAELPPSYTYLYKEFTRNAIRWGENYDKSKVEDHIRMVLENSDKAHECDVKIRELDEAEKKSPDIENLVVDRQNTEESVRDLDDKIVKIETELRKLDILLKKYMKEYDKLTSESKEGEKVAHKIEIMEKVLEHFTTRLANESVTYSHRLEENIQLLINEMLTSKRTVSVSREFAVRVTDSFGDESKSEGQFAVVSFAYIGGILKMLRSEEHLSTKEYPLVLDGPFSKLDPDQRQNVIDMIPKFAPQVVLFSKDDLHGVFDADNIGRVYTIVSNDEKNIAKVEEGHLWK